MNNCSKLMNEFPCGIILLLLVGASGFRHKVCRSCVSTILDVSDTCPSLCRLFR